MLFDIEVKRNKNDFFNYEEQYTKIKSYLYDEKIIAITGLRRVGKSSLMSVIYEEIKDPKIWIDGRKIHDKKDFFSQLNELASKISWKYRALLSLSSIEIANTTFSLKFTSRLRDIDKEIKEKAFIFIDEAQLIQYIDLILSYIYDHSKKITILLAGSEVGVLERVLGKDGGALAGRLYERIDMPPLKEESAEEFLRRGFAEAGKEIPSYEIRDAIKTLGTLTGWLTFYGNIRLRETHREAIKRVVEQGKIIVMNELINFLSKRKSKKRYVEVLKTLNENKRWKEIEEELKRKNINVPKSRLSSYLETLMDYGFVVKEEEKYKIADKMLINFLSSAKIRI